MACSQSHGHGSRLRTEIGDGLQTQTVARLLAGLLLLTRNYSAESCAPAVSIASSHSAAPSGLRLTISPLCVMIQPLRTRALFFG
jgi:hypothetical protein